VPIALRINVFIVNIDTSSSAKKDFNPDRMVGIQENKSQFDEIGLYINDNLNINDENTIYVLRKDGHYDLLY
jgi:hypothetical protein